MANTALRITEIDFDSIKTNLKNYLRSQSEFQDYDFDGSGMSVLMDLLAYNTHYMSYYLNMMSNEMFLDTAQLRSSVLSHAKEINYLPNSRRGSKALVNLLITPSVTEDQNTTTIQLNKYTRFLGKSLDGVNYNFVSLNSNTAVKTNGTFSISNVAIQQGDVFTAQYLMTPTNSKRRFEIPSANVDTNTIEVRVIESASNTDTTVYSLSNNITYLNSNSTVYFLEENTALNYNIYFGDGIIGKQPKVGNIIQITYLDTAGIGANSIPKFNAVDRISNLYRDNVIVSTVTSSYGGLEKETIEQIRFRAPFAYTTQNRAINTNDYQSLILRDYPNIDAVAVWGGEDNDPVIYGKVFISLKTKQNYALTNVDKDYIKNQLIKTRNIVTVTPEIVDPEYTYIRVVANVTYDPNKTNLNQNQLSTLVQAAIYDYNDRELSGFSNTFRKSKLQAYMEAVDKSITGSDVTIYVQKRIILNTTSPFLYNINYNMPLKRGTFKDRLYTYPEIYTNDVNGVQRNTLFEEVLDSPSGINSIQVTNGGSNYTTATVTITGDGSGATAVAKIANGKILGIEVTNKGTDYTNAVITVVGDGYDATATALLENSYGTIRSFYYLPTGEKIKINPDAGLINYSTGLLTLYSFLTAGGVPNNLYQTDTVTIFAPAGSEIIQPLRNRILVIDDADAKSVQINMVAEK